MLGVILLLKILKNYKEIFLTLFKQANQEYNKILELLR